MSAELNSLLDEQPDKDTESSLENILEDQGNGDTSNLSDVEDSRETIDNIDENIYVPKSLQGLPLLAKIDNNQVCRKSIERS